MGLVVSRIFKPKRLLYYMEVEESVLDDYYLGVVPEELAKYNDAFGTYDSPSIFRINRDNNQFTVLGIEFRPNDSRISYPDNLKCMELSPSFLIQALFTESFLDRSNINQSIRRIHYTTKDTIFHGKMVTPLKNPEVTQVVTDNGHNKILIQATPVTKEEFFTTWNLTTDNEKKLFDMAYKEPITDAWNWNYIWPLITGYNLAGYQDFQFVHFDVKDFNAINVVYSHDAGNRALVQIARKMEEADWIYESARCHNDNFCMMIKDMPYEETKQKLNDFFKSISKIDDDPNYTIFYRAGIVPMKHTILLGDRVADLAKHVQRTGNKRYETEVLFYTDEMGDKVDWAEKVKAYLDTAIENDEFMVYLQPKFDIKTEKVHGAEALVRWLYHKHTFLNPGRFIPILETGGLINKVDDIVLHKVCQNIVKWKEEGLPLVPISVNLSRVRLGRIDLVDYLTSIVDKYGVEHELIDFELTESAASDDEEHCVRVINQLKEKGFKTSIDDCGTGYSSLSSLSSLPIDTIKIDKSFADNILKIENKKDCAVLKHLCQMTKEMNLTCLCEGVEERSQIDKLKLYGCEIVQGFYYSKPLPVSDFEKLLKR